MPMEQPSKEKVEKKLLLTISYKDHKMIKMAAIATDVSMKKFIVDAVCFYIKNHNGKVR